MKLSKNIRHLAALTALVALQACASNTNTMNTPRAAYDPWKTYKLGNVYDCADIPVPDVRANTERTPTPGFGCAHQTNITLMAADPKDLVEPRAMTPSDPRRAQRVYDLYGEGGDTTSAKRVEGTQQLIE